MRFSLLVLVNDGAGLEGWTYKIWQSISSHVKFIRRNFPCVGKVVGFVLGVYIVPHKFSLFVHKISISLTQNNSTTCFRLMFGVDGIPNFPLNVGYGKNRKFPGWYISSKCQVWRSTWKSWYLGPYLRELWWVGWRLKGLWSENTESWRSCVNLIEVIYCGFGWGVLFEGSTLVDYL